MTDSASANNRVPKIAIFIHVVLPVFVGGGMYSLWRSRKLFVFAWYRYLGLQTVVIELRSHAVGMKHFIPSSIMYSLPDALWVYSFTAAMLFFWFEVPKGWERRFWIYLPVSVAIIAEFGQLVKLVPGNFDWNDVVAYLLAFVIASYAVDRIMNKLRNPNFKGVSL